MKKTACCNRTDLVQNECKMDRDVIQMDLIKLTDGNRLIRLTEPESGLTLEKMLDHKQSILRQKNQLFSVLEAALARAELHTA